MTIFFQNSLRQLRERFYELRFRACTTGYLALDFILFLVVYFLEQSILSRLFSVNIPFMLMWLTLYIIQAKPYQSFFLCFLYGNLNDLTGTVPFGFFTVSSFLIWTVLLAIRDSLSWNHLMPWIAALTLAQLGNFLFLVIVMVERELSSALNFYFFLEKFCTIFFTVLFGIAFAWPEVQLRRRGSRIVKKSDQSLYRWADEI